MTSVIGCLGQTSTDKEEDKQAELANWIRRKSTMHLGMRSRAPATTSISPTADGVSAQFKAREEVSSTGATPIMLARTKGIVMADSEHHILDLWLLIYGPLPSARLLAGVGER
jgi:hypothetical protein